MSNSSNNAQSINTSHEGAVAYNSVEDAKRNTSKERRSVNKGFPYRKSSPMPIRKPNRAIVEVK